RRRHIRVDERPLPATGDPRALPREPGPRLAGAAPPLRAALRRPCLRLEGRPRTGPAPGPRAGRPIRGRRSAPTAGRSGPTGSRCGRAALAPVRRLIEARPSAVPVRRGTGLVPSGLALPVPSARVEPRASRPQEESMSRTVVIALGVLLWAAFIAVFVLHYAAGDPAAPLVAIAVVTTAVTMWHLGRRLVRVS